MERKVGEVFNDGKDIIKVELGNGWTDKDCRDCYYGNNGIKRCRGNSLNYLCTVYYRADKKNVKFIKIGESKMDNKEELKRSLAEEEQRAKDSLANVEKMKKQLEELNKKEVEVSATGVYLDNTMEYLYSLDYDNSILYQLSANSNIDVRIKKLNLNNAFVKEEQARQETLRREGQEFIRRCAMLWNKDHDWRKDFEQSQYFLLIEDGELRADWNSIYTYGQVHFDTKELADKCIAELKAKYNEEQIKVIFGVK